jgi:hypothetical protein
MPKGADFLKNVVLYRPVEIIAGTGLLPGVGNNAVRAVVSSLPGHDYRIQGTSEEQRRNQYPKTRFSFAQRC